MRKIRQFKQSLDYYLKLCDDRKKEQDYLGALDACRNCLQFAHTRINRDSINVIIGQLYFEMGHYALSCEYFFRAVSPLYSRASAYFGVGRSLVMLNKPQLALEYFEAVLNCSQSQSFAGAVLEWSHYIKEKLQKLEFTQDKGLFTIASQLAKKGDYQQAKLVLTPFVRTCDTKAILLYANILILQGENEQAREMIMQILHKEESLDAKLVLCNLCIAEKDYNSLKINLNTISYDCLGSDKLEIIANLWAEATEWKRSLEIYLKLLEIKMYSTKYLLFCAILSYNLGNNQDALFYIGRARWIENENAILNLYYQIFYKNTILPPLRVCAQLPSEIENEMAQKLLEYSKDNTFCSAFERSILTKDDIEWGVANQEVLTDKISLALSVGKSKKITKLYREFMLSTKLKNRQKFILTRNALQNRLFQTFDLTVNYRYVSFYFTPPKINDVLLNTSLCNAVSFAMCNGVELNWQPIYQKIVNEKLLFLQDFAIDEGLLTCLYFFNNSECFNNVCLYFGAEKEKVKKLNDILIARENGKGF